MIYGESVPVDQVASELLPFSAESTKPLSYKLAYLAELRQIFEAMKVYRAKEDMGDRIDAVCDSIEKELGIDSRCCIGAEDF